ncbi:MAG: hypothetical protein ACJ79L_10225 [Anaeromyxobacteraceae bacterium]
MSEPPRTSRLAEAARAAGGLAGVLAATVLALAFVDAVPAWLVGEARDVRRVRTVGEAERRLRVRLVLPSYFPDTLAWPPRQVRFTLAPPGAAALHVDGRDGRPRVLLAETVAPGPLPERLLPTAAPLSETRVHLGAREATLARVVGEDGEVWNEVAWEQGGRTLLLRSRGSIDELLRMARSAREAQ